MKGLAMNDHKEASMPELPAWTRGPIELLRHGEEHLRAGTEFDRRMALISFDNAIEVTIATYLELTPEQRGGVVYPPKQMVEWKKTYRSKLKFYDQHMRKRQVSVRNAIGQILWHHSLRNQMYHEGNGLSPDTSAVQWMRTAALEVFSNLFKIDAESLLSQALSPSVEPGQPKDTRDVQVRFLETMTTLENVVKRSADAVLPAAEKQTLTLAEMVRVLATYVPELVEPNCQVVRWAEERRGEMQEQGTAQAPDDKLLQVLPVLERFANLLARYSISYDMLPALRGRYHPGFPDLAEEFGRADDKLRADLISVRVAQSDQDVYVVSVFADEGEPAGSRSVFTEISRDSMMYMDCLIAADDLGEATVSWFEPHYGATANADKVLKLGEPELGYLGLCDVWFARST